MQFNSIPYELSLWIYYELYKYLFFEACGYCAASWEDLSVVTGTAKASFVSCKGLLLLFVDSLPTKKRFLSLIKSIQLMSEIYGRI